MTAGSKSSVEARGRARRARHGYAIAGALLLLPPALLIWARVAAAERTGSFLARSYESLPGGAAGLAVVAAMAILFPLASMFCGICYRAHRGNFLVTASLILVPPLVGLLVAFIATS